MNIERNPITPYDASVIITPQMHTPKAIAAKDAFFGKLNNAATSEPVHAPVVGRGTATKSISPRKIPVNFRFSFEVDSSFSFFRIF